MDRLLFSIAILALALTAQAQMTTNITLTIRVVTPTSTNSPTLNAPDRYVQGFALSYAKNVALNGTNAPTFAQFVRQEITDRLKSLSDEAIADELSTNKITQASAQIQSIWSQMTPSERTNVAGIFKKYLPNGVE